MRLLTTISALVLLTSLIGMTARAGVRDYLVPDSAVSDPSFVPLYLADTIPEFRWRAYGDINGDGIDDLVLSDGFSEMSQNGLPLFVFFGDSSGLFIFYDSLYGSLGDLCFERLGNRMRIWTYWHHSAIEGTIAWQWLSDSGFVNGGSFLVFSGDMGTEMGRAMCDAVFQHCAVSFRCEEYRIVDRKVDIRRAWQK